MPDSTHRARCYRCLRPLPMCHCADLPTVATKTRIVILQHPHERSHPFGTARLARLCLPNASVHEPWTGFTGTLALPLDLPPGAAVLYPHACAVELGSLPAAERPQTLVVIDGTWAQAKCLYRENTWLHGMPHVRLQPSQPSRYRIRKEPRPDYISTLEAIVEALRLIEPETTGLESLLHAFDRMIDRQVDHVATVTRSGRFRAERNRPSRALSPLLADERLCVVYAESSLPGEDRTTARHLVHWVAQRIDDGETFDAIVRPTGASPSPHHLAHMRLDASDLEGGEVLAHAQQRWHDFVGERAALAAWTQTTLDWGRSMIPANAATTILKTSYCNATGRRSGYLEDVVRRENLPLPDTTCRGRAGERLRNAVAVARWLRSQLATAR